MYPILLQTSEWNLLRYKIVAITVANLVKLLGQPTNSVFKVMTLLDKFSLKSPFIFGLRCAIFDCLNELFRLFLLFKVKRVADYISIHLSLI